MRITLHSFTLALPFLLPASVGDEGQGAPLVPPPQVEIVEVWSRGLDALAPDARDQQTLTNVRALLDWARTKAPDAEGRRAFALLDAASDLLRLPFALHVGPGAQGQPAFDASFEFEGEEAAAQALGRLSRSLAELGANLRPCGDDTTRQWLATPAGPLLMESRANSDGGVLNMALGRTLNTRLSPPAAAQEGAVLCASIDGSALAPVLEQILKDTREERAGRVVRQVLDRLDWIGPGCPRRVLSLVHGETSSQTHTVLTGWSPERWSRQRNVELKGADLALVPAEVSAAWLGSIEPAPWFDLALELSPRNVSDQLERFTESTGVDPRADIFERLGPVAGAYVLRSSGDSLATGLVFLARANDADKVVRSIQDAICILAQRASANSVSRATWRHGGRNCASLSLNNMPLPVEPCFAAVDGVALMATSRVALRAAIDQLAGSKGLEQLPAFSDLVGKESTGLLELSWVDTPARMQAGFASMTQVLTMANSYAAQNGGPDLTTLLPTSTELSRELPPTVSRTRRAGAELWTTVNHGRSWTARLTASLGANGGMANPMALGAIASVAIPKLMAARTAANEAAAIASLRALCSAQALFQASAVVDEDRSGYGEYGLLGELVGQSAIRGDTERLDPAVFADGGHALVDDGRGYAVLQRSGYCLQVWLPTKSGATGDRTGPSNERADRVDAPAAEVQWCAYAWPIEQGSTGVRAFYVDQEGDLWMNANVGLKTYSGLPANGGRAPSFDAIFVQGYRRELAFQAAKPGTRTVDGTTWRPLE